MIEITEAPGYFVTDDGRVWSAPKRARSVHASGTEFIRNMPGKWLKPFANNDGYQQVQLGRECRRLLHRIVADAFVPKNGGTCINHIDGDKANNDAANLEWCNHSHNMQHAWDTGLRGNK